MSKFHNTSGIQIYRPSKRRDFLLVLTVYQIFLGVRYLDHSLHTIGGVSVFDWLRVIQPWHVAAILFVSSAFNLVNVITGKWVKLAFIGTLVTFCLITLIWLGSIVVDGHYGAFSTFAMHATFIWIVWLSAGVVDTPKKLVTDER